MQTPARAHHLPGRAHTFFTVDDKSHAGELQRVLREGGHEVPEALRAFGSTIKKQTHSGASAARVGVT